jgi:hypothetical protein
MQIDGQRFSLREQRKNGTLEVLRSLSDEIEQTEVFGGRHGIRTHDPHVANVVLSQLS